MNQRIIVVVAALVCLTACGKEADVLDRESAYTTAQALVRAQLKAPSSARFAAIPAEGKITKSDSLYNFSSDTVHVTIMDSTAIVVGAYEAQNSFGVYLPGTFRVMLTRKDDGWTGLTGEPSVDVTLMKNGE